MLILYSRFWGNTYLGGKFDAFFNVFCILGVFLGGGNLGFWRESPQEIAGNNTVYVHHTIGYCELLILMETLGNIYLEVNVIFPYFSRANHNSALNLVFL